MSELFDQLNVYLKKCNAIDTALRVIEWDNETLAPREANENTSKVVGVLSSEYHHALINDDVRRYLKELEAESEQEKLTATEKQILKEVKKRYEEIEKVPVAEYQAYSELISKAFPIWAEAKKASDFHKFAPILKEIVVYVRKLGNYLKKPGQSIYDALLASYDECFTEKMLDPFFEELKAGIVPLLTKVNEKKDFINKTYNERLYPVEKQKEFCRFLAEYIGFDFNRGVIAESEHPFTTNFHNHDVRITNHFYEHNLESAMLSVIHEGGHAIYEMGIKDELTQTMVGEGTSMAMHESQSRFYENMIGRSKEFWMPIYGKLQAQYKEQLNDVTLDHFIAGLNKIEPGFLRTEADELTYSLHVLIRYEIEKELIYGRIEVEDLPEVWNQKYKEYLGIVPPNDALGVLQDVHWAGGSFGYFPSYALGNAIAAQIYHYMESVMPVKQYLQEGDLSKIREFLQEHVHQYGKTKNSNTILKDMMGEELNASYYIKYLQEKYTKLYEL